MANTPIIPIAGEDETGTDAGKTASFGTPKAARGLWQRGAELSSPAKLLGDQAEHFLAKAGFDRAPWLAVLFASGIAA